MKKLKFLLLIITFVFLKSSIAQFNLYFEDEQLFQEDIYWGDIYQDSYYEFTITLESMSQDETNYKVSIHMFDSYTEWLEIDPEEFTLNNFDSQEIVFSGTYYEMHQFGEHWVSLKFQDLDNESNWQYVTAYYTSYPPAGQEDHLEWINYTYTFNEGQNLSYSAEFIDDDPISPPEDWTFTFDLFTQDGIFEYYEDYGNWITYPPYIQTWNFTAPYLPEGVDFSRAENGSVKGICTLVSHDDNIYENFEHRSIKIPKEPSKPSFSIFNSALDEVKLKFDNHKTGATSYEIYYDTEPNPPYDGTGLNQGNSPIITSELHSFTLNGLQQNTDYYFVIKAINNWGDSELSDVHRAIVFETPDSKPLYYHQNDAIYSDTRSLDSDTYYNYYFGNLIIEPGSDISMDGSIFYFDQDSYIIVEQGATLPVNGATLTGPEGKTWGGVQVWGDKNQHQYTEEGVCHQGKLILTNGATIKNAVVGVELSNPLLSGTTGGIVQATDAVFLNNTRAVHAWDYHNFEPDYPMFEANNLSSFEYCTFELDNYYIPEHQFFKHADLYDVNGIDFKACNFILGENITGVSQWNYGIASYSAGFSVTAECATGISPCAEWDQSTFEGFYSGIYATSNTSTYTFTVNRAEFNNNAHGIYANGISDATVIFSDFELGENSLDPGICGTIGKPSAAYGIDLEQCIGFAIEENNFAKVSGAPAGNYIGVRVKDCPADDIIYKNSFDGVSIGNHSEGDNYISGSTDGLSFECNQNFNNNYDFYVADESVISAAVGNHINPSGNELSQNAQVQFQNDNTVGILYYYDQNTPIEVLTLYSNFVYPIPVNNTHGCPSNYGGGSGRDDLILSCGDKLALEAEFLQSFNDYNAVKDLYNNLLDGGNTEVLVNEVESSWPNDMWELRAKLLGESPHLSTEVLKKAADKTDVLPESVLFEILAANPDELRKDELMSYLQDKAQPLPQYMIDILEQLAYGISYNTILLSEMSVHHGKMRKAAQDIIRSIVNEESLDIAELRNWLDNIGGIEADKQIIDTYIMEDDYTSAVSLLDMIPELYELSGDDLSNYNDYKIMKQLLITVNQEDRTIFDLSESELGLINSMAENGMGEAKSMAQGILTYAYDQHFCNCPELPVDIQLKSASEIDLDDLAKAMGLQINAEPNPADTWSALNYSLPLGNENATIEIVDNMGKIIEIIKVSNQKGQYVLDTRNYEPGVYIFTIKCNDLHLSKKLIIK